MTKQALDSYAVAFIKRAQEIGLSVGQAVTLLKSATLHEELSKKAFDEKDLKALIQQATDFTMQHPKEVGAGVGGLTGAAIGGLSGGGKGALIGAGTGAGLGLGVGAYAPEIQKALVDNAVRTHGKDVLKNLLARKMMEPAVEAGKGAMKNVENAGYKNLIPGAVPYNALKGALGYGV